MLAIYSTGTSCVHLLHELTELLPDYSYIMFSDTENQPLLQPDPGSMILQTFKGLEWLFNHGASLVILANTTVAAYTVRAWQERYPDKKVLSINIPAMQTILSQPVSYNHIGIISSQQAVLSGVFHRLYTRLGGKLDSTLDMVTAPESPQNFSSSDIDMMLQRFTHPLDCLLLGESYLYPWKKYIQEKSNTHVVDCIHEAAIQLGPYLEKHPDIKQELATQGDKILYTTGDIEIYKPILAQYPELHTTWIEKISL